MTNIEGLLADDADLTISIDCENLVNKMTGAARLDDQIKTGNADLEGNHEVYQQLKEVLVYFDLGSEIMPGTGAKDLTPEQKLFQQ